MTPSEKLKIELDRRLAPHGMRIVGNLWYQQGAQRRMDLCRWGASVGFRDGNRSTAVWSLASWDTITNCVREKGDLRLDFRPYRGEADILVSAPEH